MNTIRQYFSNRAKVRFVKEARTIIHNRRALACVQKLKKEREHDELYKDIYLRIYPTCVEETLKHAPEEECHKTLHRAVQYADIFSREAVKFIESHTRKDHE